MHDTQEAAHRAIMAKISDKQMRVLCAITAAPSTIFEVAQALHLPMHSVSGRVTELRRFNKIKDTGLRRMNPKSGKMGIVWAITTAADLWELGAEGKTRRQQEIEAAYEKGFNDAMARLGGR